jgi:cellulose synthase (UDP-forming)
MLDLPLIGTLSWDAESSLIPAFVAMAVVLAVTMLLPNKLVGVRLMAVLPLVYLGFRYMGWRSFETLNLHDGLFIALISVMLLGCEIFIFFVNTLSTWLLYTFRTDRSPEADEYQKNVINGQFVPCVDIFIPTVNEPLDVLRRTIMGCHMMDYPNKKLFVLDDGRRPEVKALAAELGTGYFTRDNNKHFKAGNINNALFQTYSPYIAFFDADFVPVSNFLTRTMGFFQNPKIALIQTPQSFYNPDLVQLNLGLDGDFTSEQDLFFRGIQPGRDAFNAVICCGTSFVIQRAPLEALGGVPTETITEDLMTSVYLQANGYEVAYLNEPLSFGEAPNCSVDHLKQRTRWARGILQTIFTKVNPMNCKGLNFWQRFYHCIGVLYWLTAIPRFIMLLMPLSYFYFGLVPINAQIESVLSYFVPFYIASLAMVSWFNGGRRSPFWSDVYEFIPSFVLVPNIFQTFKDPFGLGFKVTPKGVTKDKVSINWQVATPCLVIMALYIVGMGKMLLQAQWESELSALALNMVWGLYAVALFWITLLACVDMPQQRSFLRFKLSFNYNLTLAGQRYQGQSVDISEKGVRLLLPKHLTAEQLSQAKLSLPELRLFDLPITVQDKGACPKDNTLHDWLCFFPEFSHADYGKLVKGLFKRLADTWEEQTVPEWKFLWHFLKSPWRMYPFAGK